MGYQFEKMAMQIICGLIMRTNSTPISNNFPGSIKVYTTNLTHDAQILIWQVPQATVLILLILRNDVKSQEITCKETHLYVDISTIHVFTQNSV